VCGGLGVGGASGFAPPSGWVVGERRGLFMGGGGGGGCHQKPVDSDVALINQSATAHNQTLGSGPVST